MRFVLTVLLAASIAVAAEKAKPPEKAEAEARTTLLWPIWGSKTSEDGGTTVIFPFLCYGKGRESSHLAILPVYARREKEGSKAELFFPVLGRYTGKTALEPFASIPSLITWMTTEEAATVEIPGIRVGTGSPGSEDAYGIVDLANLGGLFKLLEVRRSKKGWSVELLSVLSGEGMEEQPCEGATVSALRVLGLPLVGYRGDDTSSAFHLVPVLAFGRDKEKDRRYFHVWPLFGTMREGEARSWAIAAPLVGRSVEPKKRSFYIFPVVWTGSDEEKDEGYVHVWPFVGHRRKGKVQTWSVAAPLFAYRHEEGEPRYIAALPVFARFNNPPDGRKGFYLFPVVSTRSGKEGEEATNFAVVPFYWRHSDRKAKVTVTQVLPFLHAHNEEQRGHAYGLLPFLWFSHAPKRWRADLKPFLSIGRAPDAHHVSFWPIGGWGRRGDKRRIWAALGIIDIVW